MVGHMQKPAGVGAAEDNLSTFVDGFLDLLGMFTASDIFTNFVDKTDGEVGCEVALCFN